MSKQGVTPNRLDDYLERIEALERKRRRKKLLAGVIAIGCLIGGIYAFTIFQQANQIRSFKLAELSADDVQLLFEEDTTGIGVFHPELGYDTIHSIQEYQNLTQLLDMIAQTKFQVVDETQTMPLEDLPETDALSTFVLDIAGDRKIGKPLTFTIEDYDSEVSYLIDFGNGFRRRIRRTYTYSYPRSGRFQIRLMATKEEQSSLYSKEIRITTPERNAQAQIAEASDPSSAENRDANQGENTAPASLPIENLSRVAELEPSGSGPSMPEDSQSQIDILDLRASNSPDLIPLGADSDARSLETIMNENADATPIPVPIQAEASPAALDLSKPLYAADVMPEYPGGTRGLANYFQRNNRYPPSASRNGIEGVVYVRFIVQADGDLSDLTVVKGIGYGCDKEAIRLLDRMPKWIPGEHQSTKVQVYQTLPVTFKLLN